MQWAAACAFAYFPAGHAAHEDDAARRLYRPDAQLRQPPASPSPACAPNFPRGHDLQSDAAVARTLPASWNFPAALSVHAAAAALLEYLPAGQSWQAAALVALPSAACENVPAAHNSHALACGPENVPAAQSAHAGASGSDRFPAGQLSHALLEDAAVAADVLPGRQGLHLTFPSVCWNFAKGHSLQVCAAVSS
jgi:hypothetical protein